MKRERGFVFFVAVARFDVDRTAPKRRAEGKSRPSGVVFTRFVYTTPWFHVWFRNQSERPTVPDVLLFGFFFSEYRNTASTGTLLSSKFHWFSLCCFVGRPSLTYGNPVTTSGKSCRTERKAKKKKDNKWATEEEKEEGDVSNRPLMLHRNDSSWNFTSLSLLFFLPSYLSFSLSFFLSLSPRRSRGGGAGSASGRRKWSVAFGKKKPNKMAATLSTLSLTRLNGLISSRFRSDRFHEIAEWLSARFYRVWCFLRVGLGFELNSTGFPREP